MQKLFKNLVCFSLISFVIAFEPVILSGSITWYQIDAETWNFNYTEPGWETTLIGWVEFPESYTSSNQKLLPIFIGHGNAFDVDYYLNAYCKPYFYAIGYMCFGPTLTHYDGCPLPSKGLTLADCADSPENVLRAIRTIDIILSTAFQEKFGAELIEYDSLVGFGHSFGSYLMTALTAVETRLTSSVIMSGGKKEYGTQYSDEYYAQISTPLLRLHGMNDSVIPVAQEELATEVYSAGGIKNFYLGVAPQNHAWVISTVGGAMHQWFAMYDPRNNSTLIPVITHVTFESGTVTITGHGFGSNTNGLSSVLNDESMPYFVVPGPYSWLDTEISFAADQLSSSYIVANADIGTFVTTPVVESFGGVFSRYFDSPSSPSTIPESPLASPSSPNEISPGAPSSSNSPTLLYSGNQNIDAITLSAVALTMVLIAD